jgi:hypothetical protein
MRCSTRPGSTEGRRGRGRRQNWKLRPSPPLSVAMRIAGPDGKAELRDLDVRARRRQLLVEETDALPGLALDPRLQPLERLEVRDEDERLVSRLAPARGLAHEPARPRVLLERLGRLGLGDRLVGGEEGAYARSDASARRVRSRPRPRRAAVGRRKPLRTLFQRAEGPHPSGYSGRALIRTDPTDPSDSGGRGGRLGILLRGRAASVRIAGARRRIPSPRVRGSAARARSPRPRPRERRP